MPPFSNAGNVLPLVDRKPTEIFGVPASSDRVLYLSSQLQSSLDVEDILTMFNEELHAEVDNNALHYALENTAGSELDFATGRLARHRLNYQLSLNKQSLGTLEISRRSKFTAEETRVVEELISALLYPLRNALLYRAAVSAAHKDALTGVGNRAAFDEVLHRETEITQRHDRTLGMIVFDIDHFKKINDTYGHAIGDCLLKTLTRCAANTIRLSDQLFRYGGEEFVVLVPETSISGVKRLAERIRRNLESVECACEDQLIRMTASFGVALLKLDEPAEAFFERADKALYLAKAGGRNCTRMAE